MQMFGNQLNQNDECYTTEATAEYIVTKYIDLLKGKAIVNTKPDIRIEDTSTFQTYRGIWSDLIKCNYLKYTYRKIDGKLMVKYDGTETE